MTLLKDNNYKDINVALLSLEADIKNKIAGFDTSVIDKQLAEINSRIDKINAGGNNTSAQINDIRYEIEDINSKLNGNSAKIENIEQKLSDIFSAENKVTDFNTTTGSGIYYWVTDAANKPADYGVLLVNKFYNGVDSTTGLWINQIAYGTNNKIYFRQNINSGNWTEWKAVAFDGEITAKKVANALTVNGKTYDGSEAVDAGVQTVENGGTGATDAASGFNTLADGVRDSSTPLDDEKMLLKPAGPWYKTTCLDFWNYIKGKISSVLGLTKDNYGGKASTAGTADTVDNYHASDLWRSDGATWNPNANVTMTPSGNGDEWSFDFRNKNGKTGCYWHVWDENKQTLLRVDADDGKVSAPYGFVGNLSGKASTAGTADSATMLTSKNSEMLVTNNITVEYFAKTITYKYTAGTLLSRSDWAWANSRNIVLNSSISVDTQRYSCLVIREGNLNNAWQQHALLFIPTYMDKDVLYLVQMTVSGTAGDVSTTVLPIISSKGGSFTGKIDVTAAGIRIPTSQPSSLADGDIWIS